MDFNRTIITESAQETAEVGQKLALSLKSDTKEGESPRILCLYGELGSGKTTFTQGFAKALGLTGRLLSPTFIIVRRYDLAGLGKNFYHIDLYRLNSIDEMEELGLSEIFADPDVFTVIEWADKLTTNLPVNRVDIWFRVDRQGKHHITMKSPGI